MICSFTESIDALVNESKVSKILYVFSMNVPLARLAIFNTLSTNVPASPNTFSVTDTVS